MALKQVYIESDTHRRLAEAVKWWKRKGREHETMGKAANRVIAAWCESVEAMREAEEE